MVHAETPARSRLRHWFEENPERTHDSLGKQLGVSQPAVSNWLRGASRPDPHLRVAIEWLTGTRFVDWFTPDEMALFDRLGVGVQLHLEAA